MWRKSSFSNGTGGNNCVEVARNPAIPGKVFVRSTKDRGGSVVMFTTDEWAAFLAGAKAGEFDS
jgi:hypothetical protein